MPMQKIEIAAGAEDVGLRLDRFVSSVSGLSRNEIQRLIDAGHVLLNGKPALKSYRLVDGDFLLVSIPPPTEIKAAPQDIPLDIVFEDEALVVVNKPKGMVVHPAAGNPDNTLVNALLHHCQGQLSGIGGAIRPGIVHRIDKDTSGLLVVAKTDAAHQGLAGQFAKHTILREYQAVVYGGFKVDEGVIDAPIGRSQQDRKKMAVTEKNGKPAITHYQVIARYNKFTHLALQLETGRTHQIRVHMASVGHPVAGDVVYGPRQIIRQLQGQCLHAKTLGFIHPILNKQLCFDSPLPLYFTQFIQTIKESSGL